MSDRIVNKHIIFVSGQKLRLQPKLIADALGIGFTEAKDFRHPTQTELEIINYVVGNYSHPNDTLIDPMCGVGTVIRQALRLGRNAYGLDVVEDYVTIANHLISNEFGLDDRVKVQSALQLSRATWLSASAPIKLCFFSPPLLRIARESYPSSVDQVGNFVTSQVEEWLRDMGRILQEIRFVLHEGGYLAINWRNQIANGYILPLVHRCVVRAIDMGYKLIDEKVVVFSADIERYPESVHVFQSPANVQSGM